MSSVPPGPAESVASSPPRGTTPDGNTNTRKYPRANRLAVDPSTPYYYLRCCCCCYLPLLILLLLLPYYRYQYLFTFIDYFGGDFVVDSRESVCQEVVDIYGVGCVCRCECRIHKNEDWRARPTLANDGPIISHVCVSCHAGLPLAISSDRCVLGSLYNSSRTRHKHKTFCWSQKYRP